MRKIGVSQILLAGFFGSQLPSVKRRPIVQEIGTGPKMAAKSVVSNGKKKQAKLFAKKQADEKDW